MKTWLLLVGLALLTGDVVSQAQTVINTETDLLAQPSDQLIHSSAELLAIEDQITGLPFGARLSGYEIPLFAYSYSNEEHSGSNEGSSSAQDFLNTNEAHDNSLTPNPGRVLFLHKSVTERPESYSGIAEKNKNYPALEHEVQSASSGENGAYQENISKAPPPSTKENSFEKEHETPVQVQKELVEKNGNLQSALNQIYLLPENLSQIKNKANSEFSGQSIDLNTAYLTPLTANPPPEPSVEYLVPKADASHTFFLPKKVDFMGINKTFDAQTDKKSSSSPENISFSYVPPTDEISDFLPLKDDSHSRLEASQEYLPPVKEQTNPPNLSLRLLPPEKDFVNSVISPEQTFFSIKSSNFEPSHIPNVKQTYKPSSAEESNNPNNIYELPTDYIKPQLVTVTHILKLNNGSLSENNPKKVASKLKLQHFSSSFGITPIKPKSVYSKPRDEPIHLKIEKADPSPVTQVLSEKQSENIENVNRKQRPIVFNDLIYKPLRAEMTEKIFTEPIGLQGIFKGLDPDVVSNEHKNPPIIPTSVTPEPLIVSIKNYENVPQLIRVGTSFKQESSLQDTRIEPIGVQVSNKELNPQAFVEKNKESPIRLHAEHSQLKVPIVIITDKTSPTIESNLQDYTNTYSNYISSNHFTLAGKTKPSIQTTTDKRNKKFPVSIRIPDVAKPGFANDPIVPVGVRTKINSPISILEDNKSPSFITRELSPSTAFGQHIHSPSMPYKSNYQNSFIGVSKSTSENKYSDTSANKYQIGKVSTQVVNDPIIPQSLHTKSPLSVTYKENTIIGLRKVPNEIVSIPSISEKPHECLSNGECNQSDVCQDGKCILGCSLAEGLCIGSASCETRHHIPACVCPLMFTARTVYTLGFTQFDCVPMMMSATSNNIIQRTLKQTSSRYSTLPYQRPIVAPVRNTFADTVNYPVRTGSVNRISACSPSPCGPNTRCDVNSRGIALCRCVNNYVPDGNTINGCKPQCSRDNDCPDDYKCDLQKCVRVCLPNACGLNADCDARNHKAQCSCPSGFNGNPSVRCSRNVPEIRAPSPLPIDPCFPNPCGVNADCTERGDRPVCSCPIGYEGDPLSRCIKGECIGHNDCPNHLACQRLKCIDPCVGVCGNGAECTVRNHQPVCSCPRSTIGDPFSSCRAITEYDICNPSPCGANTNCRARAGTDGLRAVCSCIDNYIGDPLSGCRAECISDNDCASNQECKNNRCRNPCIDGCGTGAYCDARNHRAVCTCPEYFQGDPSSRCYAECTTHEECPDHEACYQFQCINPCTGACGTGADCKVQDHTPICSCPKSQTGDPFISCRPFTLADLCKNEPCGTNAECHPGKDRSGNDRPVCTCPVGYIGNPLVSCQRGDCQSHNECPDSQACYAYECQSPCYTETGSVCGTDAECNVKNHTPVCSCPRGYDGNPLESCRIAANARIAGRSHRKQ